MTRAAHRVHLKSCTLQAAAQVGFRCTVPASFLRLVPLRCAVLRRMQFRCPGPEQSRCRCTAHGAEPHDPTVLYSIISKTHADVRSAFEASRTWRASWRATWRASMERCGPTEWAKLAFAVQVGPKLLPGTRDSREPSRAAAACFINTVSESIFYSNLISGRRRSECGRLGSGQSESSFALGAGRRPFFPPFFSFSPSFLTCRT